MKVLKLHFAFDSSPPSIVVPLFYNHKINIMKSLLIICSTIFIYSISFSQKTKVNEIALSTTFVWNKTTILNSYSGARAKDITGNALSSGININYSRSIFKDFYTKIGIGYFKQKFGVQRPFDLKQTVVTASILYSTKYYLYKNLHYFFGLGYEKALRHDYNLHFCLTYNRFDTYNQEYKHNFSDDYLGNINPQIEKQNYHFGQSLISQFGVSKKMYKNYKIGLDLLVPLKNKWRKDEIFREDSNEFYGSGFSIGGSINLIYSFNK